MSNDRHSPPAPAPQTGWGGESDPDATTSIEFPPGGHPAEPGADPLAAPGHGYQPPEIHEPTAGPATFGATTDPAATGAWTMPFASGGEPSAEGGPGQASPPRSTAAAMGQGAAAALAGSYQGRTDRRPLGEGPPPDGTSGIPGVPVASGTAAPEAPAAYDPHSPPYPAPAAPGGWQAPPRPAAPQAPAPQPSGGEPVPAGAAAGAAAVSGESSAGLPEPVADSSSEHPEVSYVLRVNGAERPVNGAWIGESLLYVLRERLGLAGAKDGCAQGECGACSVQVDGRLVAACLVPAATAAGSEIRTVEGLGAEGAPSDVQRALAAADVQCGFCLPGMAMTVHDLLEGNHAPTELETRRALSGNLCRCSGYRGVLDAVGTVARERADRAARAAEEAAASGPSGPSGPPPSAGPGGGGPQVPHIPHQAGPAPGEAS